MYYVRSLHAKYIRAFFFCYSHEVCCCNSGILQVDLRTSYIVLFTFPSAARFVKIANRRHFSSLYFVCIFLIILADWDNFCPRLSDCRRFLRSYYARCMSRNLCICIQMLLPYTLPSCGAPRKGDRLHLPGSLVGGG